MKLIDISQTVPAEYTTTRWPLVFPKGPCTGLSHTFTITSNTGTYIDFPCHIEETDDGRDAETCPLTDLVRVPATVIHLDRESGSGAVTADELRAAAPPFEGRALIVNALGARDARDIEMQTVWFAEDATEWIVSLGIELFVADIYECRDQPTGIFGDLFAAGISTVCIPKNLAAIDQPHVLLSALPVPIAGATQLPCRAYVEAL
jgi:kynurenine formamidase